MDSLDNDRIKGIITFFRDRDWKIFYSFQLRDTNRDANFDLNDYIDRNDMAWSELIGILNSNGYEIDNVKGYYP